MSIEIAVYYCPLYHVDPRNEQWHGKGWTEWDLVKAARPRFEGHQQPNVPAWGYFDESDPKWSAREIDLAADHGVTSFLYDWYWYDGKPFINGGLERGFLAAPNRNRLKFGLMWANHDWNNIHPCRFTNRQELLMPGAVGPEMFDQIAQYVCEKYFTQPNFLTIDGEPYFSIYELGTFLRGMGSVEAAAEGIKRFRDRAKAMGFPGLHFNVCVWGFNVLPTEIKVSNPLEMIPKLGISSVTSYCWVHHYDISNDTFPAGSYAKAAARNYEVWKEKAREFPAPYHPNVSMGWDSSPRTVQSDRYEQRGYPWLPVLMGNTPEAFRAALQKAREFIEQPKMKQKLITINAWNEWTESSYLLPDTVHGTAYLEAIRSVFGAR